jgi:ubiquinone biosynthesis protein UbiJ
LPSLTGKVIQITVRELDVPLFMKVTGNRVDVLPDYDGEIHCRMRGPVISLIKLGLSSNADAVGEDIEMSGEIEAGRQFRGLLAKVDIDWEEILSHYTGDIIAHKIGNSVRLLTGWGKKTSAALQKDMGEYLQEEGRHLPSQFEVRQYVTQVDDVRLAVERAEARIRQLESRYRQTRADADEALD